MPYTSFRGPESDFAQEDEGNNTESTSDQRLQVPGEGINRIPHHIPPLPTVQSEDVAQEERNITPRYRYVADLDSKLPLTNVISYTDDDVLMKNFIDHIRDFVRLFLLFFGRIFLIISYIIRKILPRKICGIELFHLCNAISICSTCFGLSMTVYLWIPGSSNPYILFLLCYGFFVSSNEIICYFVDRNRCRRYLFRIFDFRMEQVPTKTSEWLRSLLGIFIGIFGVGIFDILVSGQTFFVVLSNVFSLSYLCYKSVVFIVDFLILTYTEVLEHMEPDRKTLLLMTKFETKWRERILGYRRSVTSRSTISEVSNNGSAYESPSGEDDIKRQAGAINRQLPITIANYQRKEQNERSFDTHSVPSHWDFDPDTPDVSGTKSHRPSFTRSSHPLDGDGSSPDIEGWEKKGRKVSFHRDVVDNERKTSEMDHADSLDYRKETYDDSGSKTQPDTCGRFEFKNDSFDEITVDIGERVIERNPNVRTFKYLE